MSILEKVAVLLIGFAAAAPGTTAAQLAGPDTTEFRPARFWTSMAGLATADAAAMYGLNHLWYSDHDHTPFHWYRYGHGWWDDLDTYVQQDKGGHIFVSWQLAGIAGELGRWTGMSRRRAGLFGAVVSFTFQSQIELFDGFSEAFGASRTDLLANAIGAAAGGFKTAYPERYAWIDMKYSYHRSPYYDEGASSNAVMRFVGNALKDYDGISYWLVVYPSRFENAAASWPDWLGVAVGHSGTGLAHPISGRTPEGHFGGPVHRRQIYLSPDLDLLSLRDDWPQPLRAIARFFSFVRLPAPALQLTPDLRFYWIYF